MAFSHNQTINQSDVEYMSLNGSQGISLPGFVKIKYTRYSTTLARCECKKVWKGFHTYLWPPKHARNLKDYWFVIVGQREVINMNKEEHSPASVAAVIVILQ